jgi:hypothetical protein
VVVFKRFSYSPNPILSCGTPLCLFLTLYIIYIIYYFLYRQIIIIKTTTHTKEKIPQETEGKPTPHSPPNNNKNTISIFKQFKINSPQNQKHHKTKKKKMSCVLRLIAKLDTLVFGRDGWRKKGFQFHRVRF